MHTSWYSPYKEHRLVVTGAKGSIVFDDTKTSEQKLTFYRDEVLHKGDVVNIKRADPTFLPIKEGEPLKNEVSAFIEICKTNMPAITDVEEALKVQKILTEMSQQTQKDII